MLCYCYLNGKLRYQNERGMPGTNVPPSQSRTALQGISIEFARTKGGVLQYL